jgi:Carbohydrate-binding family 9
MESGLLVVRRADFSIEDPWAVPAGCVPFPLVRSTDAGTPRLKTTVVVYADTENLHVLFRAEDDEVIATYMDHDSPIYEEDVVEVFLAPDKPTTYYELEVNPLGTTFDARIESPIGVRASMRADLAWTCEDLFAAVRRVPGLTDTMLRIPFASIDAAPKNEWRANFFRIDRSRAHGDEFSAWQPTQMNPADFHVAAAFGRLRFE